MSEAPANITGLSSDAPAMIQLASTNYRPGVYNVDGIDYTYTRGGNAVRLKPPAVRSTSQYKYSYWVSDLEDLQTQLNLMAGAAKKDKQANNRYEHLKWYLWKSASVGPDMVPFLNYFKKSTNRDMGDVHWDNALREALRLSGKINRGYKGSVR
jgi:hypothetical protein